MSNSKPVPPFVLDVLRYLNRDQLERSSIVSRPLKNFIEQHLNMKPYRVFDRLWIRGGTYALEHKGVYFETHCHPRRNNYSVQQFLNGQKSNPLYPSCSYYSFEKMRPYLNPTVRIYVTVIRVCGDFTYSPKHIAEMESIAYLWRYDEIFIRDADKYGNRIVAEHFQPILDSLTILQCRNLIMDNAHFSFKDYKMLYAVRVIHINYFDEEIDLNSWAQFLEQPRIKPVVVLEGLHRGSIDNILNRLSEAFSSAVSPNALKIMFREVVVPLTEFREPNYRSRERLELKKVYVGAKVYTLERCSLKPVPPFFLFILDVLRYLNRDQLERFSIICRPLKNFIEQHLNTKPYRVFDKLQIRGGLYALFHNNAQCYPKRDPGGGQHFYDYYSFAEMRPCLGPTVRVKQTIIDAFSSAVSPNAFKIVFSQCNKPLTEFQEMNYRSQEKLELKKKINSGKTYALVRCSLPPNVPGLKPKHVPPFVVEVLCYLNRNQLERFSIIWRSLMNLIDRYFQSKPYRVFDKLSIRGAIRCISYTLFHKDVQWHPNREDYSVQQFLDGQECNIEDAYYSFAEMRPYLGPTVRVNTAGIEAFGDFNYDREHIAEMESISYLWRDGDVSMLECSDDPDVLQPVLNSPTVLQCQKLRIAFHGNEYYSFKDYKVLYSLTRMNVCYSRNKKIDPNTWPQFLEQPGVKPLVILQRLHPENINQILDQLSKAFSSAVSPNAYKIEFKNVGKPLTVFREMNYRSREKLQLKKKYFFATDYTLERCSLPPIVFDWLYYLNRSQLERFSIVCRELKNFIDRYLRSKPYRVFDQLHIRGGSYALRHKQINWQPNQSDYIVQFYASINIHDTDLAYYSFAEMRPYFGPAVRVKVTTIFVAGNSTYNPEHIAEIESIANIWRDGDIFIRHANGPDDQIVAEHFQPILNSPAILKCRDLKMDNAHFSLKDYKILYSVKVIEIEYKNDETDPNYWSQFLEQPGVKPVVILRQLYPESVVGVLERLYQDFSSAISPKAYKIVFAQNGKLMIKFRIKSIVQSFKKVYTYSQPTVPQTDEELIEFQDKNKTSGEKWEFRKPAEFSDEYPEYELSENNKYVLERSRI
ncbi:hypothetical protein DdX_22157 [Ditylenchus destructor]|uniref:F-box domain-containing protein n=1 Tax=Ditylenchus destructor TaxID=166010 RepID=A0AAD4MDX3_9BILA|nr:hypothetical protein DdX_22157 [Ditylenchus destructor]